MMAEFAALWQSASRKEAMDLLQTTAWQRVGEPQRHQYIANAYRVLLTRARQGLVIFVPPGDDLDPTRAPAIYNPIFSFLEQCGLARM